MWGEVRRCGGLPALARVRAARGVRVVGEEGAQKGVDDGRVGAVAGELVRARVADNLGQVEVCVREGEDGEVVASVGAAFTAGLEWRHQFVFSGLLHLPSIVFVHIYFLHLCSP